jgi:hypothetical protein
VRSVSLVIAERSPPVGVLRLVMCATGRPCVVVICLGVATSDRPVQAGAVSEVVPVVVVCLLRPSARTARSRCGATPSDPEALPVLMP